VETRERSDTQNGEKRGKGISDQQAGKESEDLGGNRSGQKKKRGGLVSRNVIPKISIQKGLRDLTLKGGRKDPQFLCGGGLQTVQGGGEVTPT